MNIEQYCSVCKAVLDMAVVPTAEGDDDGVVWLRCPRCHGYLPKISAGLSASRPAAAAAEEAPATDASAERGGAEPSGATAPATAEPPAAPLPDFDPTTAVPYRPWGSYEVGAVIHHLAWDDYGVVLAKETLPGRRRAVKVQFERAGIVRLIEESDEGA